MYVLSQPKSSELSQPKSVLARLYCVRAFHPTSAGVSMLTRQHLKKATPDMHERQRAPQKCTHTYYVITISQSFSLKLKTE